MLILNNINNLYLKLESITKENNIKVKAKEFARKELVNTAWKTHCKGYISAFDYARICEKNNQLSF